jgi:putative ABC transport system permease protein
VNRTYGKTFFREIKHHVSHCAVIFVVVALSVAFLSGLFAITPDMKTLMDRYFDRVNMMDIVIKARLGLNAADIEALRSLNELEYVLPAYVSDALMSQSRGETLAVRIYGLPLAQMNTPRFVNRMDLIEGTFPSRENECLVQQGGNGFEHIALGTTLRIVSESDMYRVTEYNVTGVVKSPLYIATERESTSVGSGRLNTVIYVYESAYTLSTYTDCYITLKNTRSLTAFTDAYQTRVDRALARIEALGIQRAEARKQEVLDETRRIAGENAVAAEAELRDTELIVGQELNAARIALDTAREEITTEEAALAEAEQQLAESRAQFTREQEQISALFWEQEARLRSGEADVASARARLAASKQELDNAQADIEKTRSSWLRMLFPSARKNVSEYDARLATYNQSMAAVDTNEAELAKSRQALVEAREAAETGSVKAREELDAAELEIISRRWRLADAHLRLAEDEAEYERRVQEAEERLRTNSAAIAATRRDAANVQFNAQPEWYVLDRNSNEGYSNYRANVEKIDTVAKVFPLFFLLIAVIAVLATMTRMVEEERIQIGVLKALGYKKRTILATYLITCGISSVAGSVAGMLGGFWGLPLLIYRAFATIHQLPPFIAGFNWQFGLIACGLALISVLGATICACYRALWEKPASLMRPRQPKVGKRVFLEYLPFWKRLKSIHKLTARNLIRQKKHFFMSIIGIAACAALMLAGFGLRDSTVDIAHTQFEDIFIYNVQLSLSYESAGTSVIPELLSAFSDWTFLHNESGVIIAGKERVNTQLITLKNTSSFPDFINLRSRLTHKAIPFTDDSVILTESVAAALRLKPGDHFTLENSAGVRATLTLTGITENFVGVNCYLGPTAYESGFGVPVYKTIWVHTGSLKPAEQDALAQRLLASSVVISVEFTSHVQESYKRLLGSISFVVAMLIATAGALAATVLYSLTNKHIMERTQEIATLRVLGFHHEEIAVYIFREIAIFSAVGTTLGLVMGVFLHHFIISVAENTDLMFGPHISPFSVIFSTLIMLALFAIVAWFTLKNPSAIKRLPPHDDGCNE